jgi:hypothetical protein
MKKLLPLTLILFFASACAFHSGTITTAATGSNFIYKTQAQGQAKSWALFGLGGVKRDALVYEAKQKLFQYRPLKAGETYANFTVDFKYSIILIYSETKVTVTADILEYKQVTPQNRYGPYYPTAKTEVSPFNRLLFITGDTVMGPDLDLHQVTGFTDKGLVVRNLSMNDHLTDIVAFDEVFFTAQDQSEILQRLKRERYTGNDTNLPFSVFDTVVVDIALAGHVILKLEEKEALVMPILGKKTPVGKTFSIKRVAIKDLFIKKPNFKGLATGDTFNKNGLSYTILFFGTESVIAKPSKFSLNEKVKYRRILP